MVSSAAAVREALAKQQWDLITSDFAMPGFDGLSALAIVREHGLDVPFILVSGKIGEERAIEAMHRGATDYVLRPNSPLDFRQQRDGQGC
jgi:sigma-B regulation protein RsbU (phosphoserine phosphatase)